MGAGRLKKERRKSEMHPRRRMAAVEEMRGRRRSDRDPTAAERERGG
jgi:hypothetical protein